MRIDFDSVPDRHNTRSFKWDNNAAEFPERPDAIPMWVADMDFACPKEISDAIQARAAHPVYGYSFMEDEIAELVAGWEWKRNNWKIDPSWVTYINGVVPALGIAVNAFAEEGEGVILMNPVYYPFTNSIVNNKRTLLDCGMVYNGTRWEVDYDKLEELASRPDAKLLLLCNPHNPLGRCFEKEELLRIGEICLKNHVIIMSDEIHSDLIFEGHKHTPIASLSPEFEDITITAMAPSKTFNIAGLQMSALITKNETLRNRLYEALGFDCIPSLFGGVGFRAAYSEPGCVEYLEQLVPYLWNNYRYIEDYLKENTPKITVQRPEATYLLWFDCRALGMDDTELRKLWVEEAGIGIELGSVFGGCGQGYIRMNIGCTHATVVECMRRLGEAYRKRGL